MYRTIIARNTLVKTGRPFIGPQCFQIGMEATRHQSNIGIFHKLGFIKIAGAKERSLGRTGQDKSGARFDKEFFENVNLATDDIQVQINEAEKARDPGPLDTINKMMVNTKNEEDMTSEGKSRNKESLGAVFQDDREKHNAEQKYEETEISSETPSQNQDINYGQRAKEFKKTG